MMIKGPAHAILVPIKLASIESLNEPVHPRSLTRVHIKRNVKNDRQDTIRNVTLKAPRRNASENVVCCKLLPNITEELSLEANSVDPEQTAPIGAVWSGSTLFAIEAS